MIVDSTNLAVQLPHMLDAIARAEFVAFDTEFTGLRVRDQRTQHQLNPEDSNECRFQELRVPGQQFRVIQLGICCFVRCSGERPQYEARRWSVMVYKRAGRGEVLLVEIDSFRFLSEHSFDFNRLVSAGCDYSGTVKPGSCGVLGLDQLLHALCKSGCPLVGHNCLRVPVALYVMALICRWTGAYHDGRPVLWPSGRHC